MTVKVWGIHVVSPEEEKERLQWEYGCNLFTVAIRDGGLEAKRRPADRGPGLSPRENFWNCVRDLVHFDALWWQLFVGRCTQ